MDTITSWIALPLGYVMEWCYKIVQNYGLAIIFFTLLTKIILMPISVWMQKNSIKMVEMQPGLNRIKIKYYGDLDTIADEQSKLYKKYHYNPLSSLIPLAIQLILLMGVVGVIYNPLQYLFHLPQDLISAMNQLTSSLTGASVDSSIQLAVLEAIKNPEFVNKFLNLQFQFPNLDLSSIVNSISNFKISFLGIDLSWTPSIVKGITYIVPVLAGLSSYIMSYCQNKANVLQTEQSKLNKYSMLILSVALSLYLGFFVPSGIALYWISSNLMAIATLYILNAAIPPKKYVDYEALEATRKELSVLDNLEEKSKPFHRDPNKKREKADYKKFFGIVNKHVVFYSERSGFYKYYQATIEGLLKRTNLHVHYITNDPNDAIFELAKKEPRIRPYYIGIKKLVPLMMKMDADIVIMTTPDLNNFYLKRSLVRKDVEYIYTPHDCGSMHMGFREHALDNFDTIFMTGPFIKEEIRATEKVYNTKEKTLIEFGYPLIDNLISSYEKMDKKPKERKQILIAPSWQEDNLLDSCIDKLIEQLYCDEYHLIVRPHPEYMKRYKPKIDILVDKYKDKIGDSLTFELDFSTNVSTYSSDLLITDWSSISNEFCFATLKPALYINTKLKMENPNYENIGIVPKEIWLRDKIGISLNKDELDKTRDTARILLANQETYHDKIYQIREKHFYHLGSNGVNGINYIIDKLSSKQHK